MRQHRITVGRRKPGGLHRRRELQPHAPDGHNRRVCAMMDFLSDIDIDMGRDDSPKIGRQRSNRAGIMGIRWRQAVPPSLRYGGETVTSSARTLPRFSHYWVVTTSYASGFRMPVLSCLLATDNPVGIPRMSEARAGTLPEAFPWLDLGWHLMTEPIAGRSVF